MKKILTIQMKIDDSGKPMKPEFIEIDNTLKAMQEFVSGNIEVVNIEDIIVVMNEEGKLRNLPLNCILFDENREVIDGLVGNLLCCRVNSDGDFVSIKENDLEILEKHLIQVYKKEVISWH